MARLYYLPCTPVKFTKGPKRQNTKSREQGSYRMNNENLTSFENVLKIANYLHEGEAEKINLFPSGESEGYKKWTFLHSVQDFRLYKVKDSNDWG